MKSLLVTREIQNGFMEAIRKRDIRNWYESNTDLLITISESLKSLEIPRSQRDKERICEFICQSFFTLFLMLCGEETDELRPESYTGGFLLKLKASYVSNDWRQFYNDHEHYFDYLINLARVQKIIDIKIEAKNGTVWDTFHEAKNSIRTPSRSFWFCCVGTVTPPVDQKKENETEVVTVQPKEHAILPDVIPIPSETGAPELVAVPSENIQNNDSFEDFEKEINKIVNDVTDFRNESIGSKPPATEKEKERPGVHRTPSLCSNTSSLNFTNRCNEADASFRRKLDAQNERFNEEMRKIREKREQMNREAEEDMRQFRKESSRRIQMFLNCIKLRIRWEEQEQEWGDWLKTMRGTVVKVKTTFLDFDHNRKFNDEEDNVQKK
ncbi:hypothetical protein CRE_22822 [Caenorhabditis remanei]|uniref:Uncharacterized protein n=1 Tax=Caenorhabditis remanei TaxID=31234 RepID=E3MHF3_CAERE|nr:hypothetical protein CRE_22822 [Caenorhabditis remanei]